MVLPDLLLDRWRSDINLAAPQGGATPPPKKPRRQSEIEERCIKQKTNKKNSYPMIAVGVVPGGLV